MDGQTCKTPVPASDKNPAEDSPKIVLHSSHRRESVSGDKTQGRHTQPALPTTIKDTGLNSKFLSSLLLKNIYLLGLETGAEISDQMKLSPLVVDQLVNLVRQQGLVEVRGALSTNVPTLRFALTEAGRAFAAEACRQCEYVGPAPVTLAAYQAQVKKQSIAGEAISVQDLASVLSHLVVPQTLIRRLGPAVNSGRAILIYGPPGNGKTSISESIGKVFKQPISVPYCVEVDGQIIRIFDPTVHTPVTSQDETKGQDNASPNILAKKPDPRWVRCRRPVIIMGGELTLDMLDLEFDPTSKFYEAPSQVKALGGVFIIDDFGRQLVQPRDLLNRWIIPLEKRVDYLTIHTGKKFDIPFDELVIFSTNLSPTKLMDTALLRRVKYKLRVEPPSVADFIMIFDRVCAQHGLELPDTILKYLLEDFYPRTGSGCAAFHPIFIVEHVIATCRYEGIEPRLTVELVKDALDNIFISSSQEGDLATSIDDLFQTRVG